ncbi:MAG: hypothetical protein IPM42_22320, partial [Saprospiraceae bacterium]|nr:hypothetical protein [Saprospiraceae bacterium]
SENKKYATAQPIDRQKSVAIDTKTVDRKAFQLLSGQKGQLVTRVWQKWRFSTPQTHLWFNQSLVLRINICGKNRHPSPSPKPLGASIGRPTTRQQTDRNGGRKC